MACACASSGAAEARLVGSLPSSKALRRVLAGAPARGDDAGDPLEAVVPLPGGKTLRPARLLQRMRELGIRGPAVTAEVDTSFARALATVAGSRSTRAGARDEGGDVGAAFSKPDTGGELARGTPESSVEPDAFFGVAEAVAPHDVVTEVCQTLGGREVCYTRTTTDRTEGTFGTAAQVVADLASMGAGSLRRFKKSDLLWGSLFPQDPTSDDSFQYGVRVPPPNEILEDLRANDYHVLNAFGELALACLTAGVKINPTPFHLWGGGALTYTEEEMSESDRPYRDAPVTFGEMRAGRPSHQKGFVLPSKRGWDAFYYDVAGGTDAERAYQRYCLNVWPSNEGDVEGASAYMLECARRKSLAVAAFSWGIGEYLGKLNQALLETSGASLYDVVQFVETGNEMDGQFELPEEVEVPVGFDFEGPITRTIVASGEEARRGQREAGKYMALVAGPIRHQLPDMKFKASDLLSYTSDLVNDDGCVYTDTFRRRCEWLKEAVLAGIGEEAEWWNTIQANILVNIASLGIVPLSATVSSWYATGEAAGFFWPPVPESAGDFVKATTASLVHQVGFHWYKCYDARFSWKGRKYETVTEVVQYQDAARLQADVETFREAVVDPLAAEGVTATVAVGEIAFPALRPDDIDLSRARDDANMRGPFYVDTSQEFQAAMLARHFLLLRGLGVDNVFWFCHMLKPMTVDEDGEFAEWPSKHAHQGLRNEARKESVSGYYEFQAKAAWPRSAWFTYRRVAWLVGAARSAGIVVNERGLTVVELKFPIGLSTGPDGESFGERYTRAYVAWLDQYVDSDCLHGDPASATAWLVFPSGNGHAYELLSLVPEVAVDFDDGVVDANGYKAAQEVDWEWVGWDGATDGLVAYRGYAVLQVRKADPTSAIAPICLLTTGELLGWSHA